LAAVPTQLKFSIVKDHDEPTMLLFETLFCMWECFNMGTELPAKVILGQALVLMRMTFLNNVRKVGRLVLSRTSCYYKINLSLSIFCRFNFVHLDPVSFLMLPFDVLHDLSILLHYFKLYCYFSAWLNWPCLAVVKRTDLN
jgi:hypothetical protein